MPDVVPPLPAIAITLGDPAGIGPELALKAVAEPAVVACCAPLVVGSRVLLNRVARRLGLPMPVRIADPGAAEEDLAGIQPGRTSAACGRIAAASIEAAIAGTRAGHFAALVTNPICKASTAAAGIPFPGHTEWLADRCGVTGEVMLMAHPTLNVALATCHQSLASVPTTLTRGRIVETGRLLGAALARSLGRPPRLAVLGLNPHAGEDGLFGDEEERLVQPAVAELRALGFTVVGPLPADTAFTPANRQRIDGYVALYHDQGLIPFKALCFDEGVNVTLGLPIIRTSVDHGTAFDIAWQGRAHHQSLVAAIRMAAALAGGRPAS